ncbi:hypothetical protein V1477_011327 [Vespula maculifrons]|uniref:Uncharacterized protein n=1 Tax=Vespula maculifrons TaxID=7453 RepID=A0ABD2C6E8_VESMC
MNSGTEKRIPRCRRTIHTKDRIGQYDQLHRQNEWSFIEEKKKRGDVITLRNFEHNCKIMFMTSNRLPLVIEFN